MALHNLTHILRRGLEAAEDHCLLSATALNLKRMIKCMGWRRIGRPFLCPIWFGCSFRYFVNRPIM